MYKILSTQNSQIISVNQLKGYLKIHYDDDDNLLSDYIAAGVQMAENFMNISLNIKVVEFSTQIDNQVRFGLPVLPFLSLEQAMLYPDLDITSQCEVINHNLYINKFYQGQLNVIYKCGFAPEKVAYSIKQGILSHAAAMYEKQTLDHHFLNCIYNFYRPFRKVLI